MSRSILPRALPTVLLLVAGIPSSATAANIAPEGTGIIGVNDSADFTDLGTSLVHAGAAASINDADANTRVDTFGNGSQDYSYVGVEWGEARPDAVKTLVLTMATFFDGGWFGPNGSNPGAGGALSVAHLTEPVVQISTDSSATWTTVPSTSTYLAAFTGHQIGGNGVVNPSKRTASFNLTDAVTGLTGIRLIGPNGGPADGNGFIGVFELEVIALESDVDGDGMSDVWETAHSLNPAVNDAAGDPDSDGLPNLGEFTADLDPQNPDSDADGLKDGPEVLTFLSDPHLDDTDNDGLLDGAEVNTHQTSPTRPDTDGDGLSDFAEITTWSTNPNMADTDGDAFNDAVETRLDTDPLDPSDHPDNIALLGTGILGVNDAVDADAGTPRANAGSTLSINDADPATRVDTFGVAGSELTSFVGILWPAPALVTVDRIDFTMAVFFDGGWFGPNGSNPGAGGMLASGDLIEPVVQVTTDGGVTWSTVAATSDYLTVFDGHALPGVAFGPPTSATATFTLTPPQTGANGVRLIETNGGPADGNGFLGVFELAVSGSLSGGGGTDADGDGQSDADEAIAGTNPANPNDSLRIRNVERTGDQIVLTWTSVPGKTYRVESSDALVSWTALQSGIPAAAAPATTTQATLTLPAPLPSRLHVRVAVQSP